MAKKTVWIAGLCLLFTLGVQAQVREVPKAVDEAFYKKYPTAEKVEFVDNLLQVRVRFEQDGEKYLATFTNKGFWRETEQQWAFDKLPEDVQDGFKKSKYADWEVAETAIVYRAGGTQRYRLRAEKSGLQKKHLFFNEKGRLMEESIKL